MRQKILVIVGATASGKSTLSVRLARKYNGEVVSADSRQIYRGLNIGTAKITKREMAGVRHHLLNEVTPHCIFTAHDFIVRASKAVSDISKKGRLPIIAGGTGFYIDALSGRIMLPDVPANPALRARLEKKTAAQLFAPLKKRDPLRARKIDMRNKHRLIRALEIAHAIGKVPRTRARNANFDALWIGLKVPKDELRKKIRARARKQIKNGLIGEVSRLIAARVPVKRIRAFGFEYSLALDYTAKKIGKDELLPRLDAKTWQYARRQMSYWKRNKNIRWFGPSKKQEIFKIVGKFLLE